MRLPGLLSRPVDPLPGVGGTARISRSTDRLMRRIRPGDVVIIDAPDLDRETAESLVASQPVAVVNTSPSISGRYPNTGPSILIAAGIELVDVSGSQLGSTMRDGAALRLHEGSIYAGERLLAVGARWDRAAIAQAMNEARDSMVAHLEAFSGNMVELIHSESALLLDGSGIPGVTVRLAGRHVVMVTDGPGHTVELKKLQPFIREFHPVLVGVDRGADSLMRAGYRPELIVGDPDIISGSALRCGAEVVLPAAPDGHAPGLTRLQDLGIGAVTFPAVGSSMDLALLLAHHHGAALIVTVGNRVTLNNLFERHGQQTTPATFLTRLRVGARVVEAGTVATLYRTGLSPAVVVSLLMAALAAVFVAVVMSAAGSGMLDWGVSWWNHGGGSWWNSLFAQVKGLVS